MSEDANRLVAIFLSGRRQLVVVGGKDSSLESICIGVSQGSMLGPLLFLVTSDDLDCCIPERMT